MSGFKQCIRRLFNSTEGLLLVVTGWDALLVALLGTLSATGPLAGLDVAARLGLDEAGRVGRIIMLYHGLAVPFVAALTYFILDLLPFEEKYPRIIRPAITAGYMLASAGGLGFAYPAAALRTGPAAALRTGPAAALRTGPAAALRTGPAAALRTGLGWGWMAHGLFVVGLSLVFYAGVVLCVGLWPWRGDFTAERLAFWLMALYTLISATIGGAVGAYFGNGFEAFLAEDVVRGSRDLGQLAIIAHLHIMLTLIDVALLLIIARRFDLRGRAGRAATWLTIVGTTIVSFATWGVMVIEEIAHKIINVGAAFLLPGAIIVALYGFGRIVRERGMERATVGQKLRALLSDPVRFGILFELIFVNVVVTGPGVYVAFNLETYRQPAFLEVERTILVGHWHVLATLSAVIALLLVVDRLGVRGFLRQLVGWGVLVGSTLIFIFVQVYMFRQPGQEAGWTAPFLDVGIALFLVTLAVFLVERLVNWIWKR